MPTEVETIESLASREYQYGFITDIGEDSLPPGLNEDVVRAISAKKHEPEFMLEWRLNAYRHWQTMTEPTWPNVHYPRHRLSEYRLLFGPEIEGRRSQEPG